LCEADFFWVDLLATGVLFENHELFGNRYGSTSYQRSGVLRRRSARCLLSRVSAILESKAVGAIPRLFLFLD
jgi:hypothetical protein